MLVATDARYRGQVAQAPVDRRLWRPGRRRVHVGGPYGLTGLAALGFADELVVCGPMSLTVAAPLRLRAPRLHGVALNALTVSADCELWGFVLAGRIVVRGARLVARQCLVRTGPAWLTVEPGGRAAFVDCLEELGGDGARRLELTVGEWWGDKP